MVCGLTKIQLMKELKPLFLSSVRCMCRKSTALLFYQKILLSEETYFWLDIWFLLLQKLCWAMRYHHNERYRAIVTIFFVLQLDDKNVAEEWFHQDCTTCHIALKTIALLQETFDEQVISLSGGINGPPRSWNLAPLDYFRWRYVKSLDYADRPATVKLLEAKIPRVNGGI